MLTSVDKEGTAKGFDVELVKAVTDIVTIPVIASGGMGKLEDIDAVVENGHTDAIAMAHVLHYGHQTINSVRDYMHHRGINTRQIK